MKKSIFKQFIFVGICITANQVFAQKASVVGLSGEQIYKQTCAACHASGVANKAPKFGDVKAWRPLIAKGQHIVTGYAWVGVRAMPAKGGRNDLSLEDFSKSVAYMARAAGGHWGDPDTKLLIKIRREVQLHTAGLKATQSK